MTVNDYIVALKAGVDYFAAGATAINGAASNPVPTPTNALQKQAVTSSPQPARAVTPAQSASWFTELLALFQGANWSPVKLN